MCGFDFSYSYGKKWEALSAVLNTEEVALEEMVLQKKARENWRSVSVGEEKRGRLSLNCAFMGGCEVIQNSVFPTPTVKESELRQMLCFGLRGMTFF